MLAADDIPDRCVVIVTLRLSTWNPTPFVRHCAATLQVSTILQSLSAPRRRGRPKQIWVSEVYRMGVEIAEGPNLLGDLLRDAAKQRGNACAIAASAPPSVRSWKKVWAVMGEAWSPRTWRTTFAVQKNTFIRATSEPVLPHPILSMIFFEQKINPHCSAVRRIHIKRSLASFKFISATCFIPFLVRLAGQTVRFRGTTLYAKRIFVA